MMTRSPIWKYSLGIKFLCVIGILLSAYSLYVKYRLARDSDYEALCDLSDRIKCTKVFHSRYGNGFGIIGEMLGGDESIFNQPNGINGIIFYTLIILLDFSLNLHLTKLQVALSFISNLISIYLAYLLYFVFENLCIVCATLYVVNMLLLILSVKRYSNLVKNVDSRKNK
ncbi:vitamin K epoxide reductase complex subunit 1 [Bradysia coprophila]|uniref:vitamin K epoxide reductase complex subunit 1 n=1 Tax=Bradysia coprophila TaxID=38358 RepID=UPI00187D8056|nr:vitamin K epoxide reductase complex subunit 1 [Bradysia coprophila]XP_037049058.1 vitamin K epoxide reductase complex subunit 1 [Bradysia coprophila]